MDLDALNDLLTAYAHEQGLTVTDDQLDDATHAAAAALTA